MLDAMTTHPMVIVPGINDSGPTHWQTLWQASHPDARRIEPTSFDQPDLEDWVRALDVAVGSCAGPPLLVAHSLGTLAVLEWVRRFGTERVAAALLVAPPDPHGPNFPTEAPTFVLRDLAPLGIPAAVVGSTDDPYDPDGFAARVAAIGGASLHLIGDAGHLNASSELGEWLQGRQILSELVT